MHFPLRRKPSVNILWQELETYQSVSWEIICPWKQPTCEKLWAMDTRTLSPIKQLLTGSSSALGSEGGAGHIWDMYSGCQHEASHTKLWLESHLLKKTGRTRGKCLEIPVQRGLSRQFHQADGSSSKWQRSGKKSFCPSYQRWLGKDDVTWNVLSRQK